MSVAITLADNLDVGRGDMICRPGNQPHRSADIDAMICWFDDSAVLTERSMWAIKHTTRNARVQVRDLRYRLDVNTLHRDETVASLGMNDIGRISLRSTVPLLFDEYRRNRSTGSFILIDEHTNATVAAGMIIGQTAP
jgi:sulfate adenylyltransferase subunit 1 (EFTu-like GTPase family)